MLVQFLSAWIIMKNNEQTVIIFDASCNLCSSLISFIIRHDRTGKFKFASQQSSFAKQKMQQIDSSELMPDSIIYIDQGNFYSRSDAALRIAKKLGGIMTLAYAAYILPRNWRDGLYDYMAKNRYRWFGKREECMLGGKEIQERFID